MALFCAALKRNSVFLLKLPFLSDVQVFSCEISLFRLDYSYICFSSHFCSPVIVFLFMLSDFFLDTVISLSLLFLMQSSSPRIGKSTLSTTLACSPPSAFLTQIIYVIPRM